MLQALAALSVFVLAAVAVLQPEDHEARVAVTHEDFNEKLRGRAFHRWSDFKNTLGPEAEVLPAPGGEIRLVSGLSISFVIIVNVLIWALVTYVATRLSDDSPRKLGWLIFGILCVYSVSVYLYCQHAYEDPALRVMTNFLFGLVPLAVSFASYVLALLVLDFVRSDRSFDQPLLSRLRPWEETFDGRLVFFLAVLPGLVVSIYLGRTVSTGFEAAATHFDVLSLCLFIDVGRFAGHCSYLLAREWSIGKSPTSISSRPGLCYVFHGLCLAWYLVLARFEAGGESLSVLRNDRTKTHTLVSLTSFVFFPLSIYLAVLNLRELFEMFEVYRPCLETLVLILSCSLISAFMLLVAMVFDAIEPNVMGIGGLLWVVFYGAGKLSHYNLLLFVVALVPLSAFAFGAAMLSTHYAQTARDVLLSALAP
mmetsp:Transcript_44306/g.102318  ORF Transcript_44306/g.102318 Transcript_44306/m.102318 type:complete len:423 (-) Transcript_44306:176-1444(-)